ncbi:hypothetical protein L0152_29370 [bacterium]|nr:hypothetical protein [bacterium]
MFPTFAGGQDTTPQTSIDQLKSELELLKADYENRIKALEEQVTQLQTQILQAAPVEVEQPAAQPTVQTIPGALNPAIAVVGNFVGRSDDQDVFNEDGAPVGDRLNLREAEIDMRVAVDPYADGVLITALESETPGEFEVGVEEGYVNIKKLPFQEQPPLGLRFKVGRFRPAFGKINVLHTHDLPQSFRPLPVTEFLGEEGYIGNGVSGNFFIPTPWDENSSIDATIDVITGGNIALSPELESRLAYQGHLRWFRTFAGVNNVELGFSSYYHPGNETVRYANLNGIDFLYRWKPFRMGEYKSYLLGGEFFWTGRAYPEAEEGPDVSRAIELQGLEPGDGNPKGLTLWTQWQFNRRLYAGVRYDQTDTLFNPDFSRQSFTPYISYYFSEFLRFRINYEHRWSDFVTEDGRNSLFFELNWIFGAHPPEPFWVNK